MQKQRVGKVDAWIGYLGGVQKHCLAHAERIKAKTLVELTSVRQEGLVGKRLKKT